MKIRPTGINLSISYAKLRNFANSNKISHSGIDTFEKKITNPNVAFGKNTETNFKLNLSTEELDKRTSKDYLAEMRMLTIDAPEYQNLETGDKKALEHLVKAAKFADSIYMKQDNRKNIPFLEYLNDETKKGNKKAQQTKLLMESQKSIIGIDNKSNPIVLLEGEKELAGKAFYPADLSKKEFHIILKTMLKDGETEEVKNILNQRSIVERDGDKLKAIDYTTAFEEEFTAIADELELAAKYSTNEEFNKYLKLQANALRENDPMLDAIADKQWATLQDTPLEFTLGREQYQDLLTGSVLEDEELKLMLEENGITPTAKDSIGIRVGIVNQQGTQDLLKIKKYLPIMAQNMPLNDKYEQNISQENDNLQTMVDADIVTLTGFEGACNGGILIAQNLPNNDKLSLKIGGGRRNVYHRQVRNNNSDDAIKKRQAKLDEILNPELHKYYNKEADHWFTVGHENAHSLGPKEGTEALGKYKNIIEENKADMGSIALLDCLCDEGVYTDKEKKEILTTFAVDLFLKAKPKLTQAHRVRSVMQANYFIKEGAISVNDKGIIDVNFEKMVPTANKMLTEIVDIQLSKDVQKAENFIEENFVWTDEMQIVSEKLNKSNKVLNTRLTFPLADYLETK